MGFGLRGDLTDQLLAAGWRRERDRSFGEGLAAAGGDDELEAGNQDANDQGEHMFALGCGRRNR
jgi:hypothetical protein